MVLDHVAQSTRMLVVCTSVLHAHLFGNSNLHMVDVAAVPDRLEKRIGKAKGKNVLNGLLAQVVIYPIDLFFVKDFCELGIQSQRRLQVMTERLFHDNPDASFVAGQLGRANPLDNGFHNTRRRSQVKDLIDRAFPFLLVSLKPFIQGCVGRGIGKIA